MLRGSAWGFAAPLFSVIIAGSLLVVMFVSVPEENVSAENSAEKPTKKSIPTTVRVEPKYDCDLPLYAQVVFGENNEKPMWIVLDKSESESEKYDKLFVDLNSNGDLTEPGESFDLTNGPGTIDLPDLEISESSSFSKISIRIDDSEQAECMVKAVWNDSNASPKQDGQSHMDGEIQFGGGYPETSKNGYMIFGKSVQSAPVVCFRGSAPFEFQPWYPESLLIGSGTDFKVFMGHKGRGNNSFCSTLGYILPAEEAVLATLNYADEDGNKKRADVKLKERC